MSIPVPRFTLAAYTKDVESGRYLKDTTIVSNSKFPPWIRVSLTIDRNRKAVGAPMMADGPKRKGEGLHAGLIETGIVDWYVTDIPDTFGGQVCKNIALFHFSTDRRTLTVRLFTGFQKPNIEERVKAARAVIPHFVADQTLPRQHRTTKAHP